MLETTHTASEKKSITLVCKHDDQKHLSPYMKALGGHLSGLDTTIIEIDVKYITKYKGNGGGPTITAKHHPLQL